MKGVQLEASLTTSNRKNKHRDVRLQHRNKLAPLSSLCQGKSRRTRSRQMLPPRCDGAPQSGAGNGRACDGSAWTGCVNAPDSKGMRRLAGVDAAANKRPSLRAPAALVSISLSTAHAAQVKGSICQGYLPIERSNPCGAEDKKVWRLHTTPTGQPSSRRSRRKKALELDAREDFPPQFTTVFQDKEPGEYAGSPYTLRSVTVTAVQRSSSVMTFWGRSKRKCSRM